MNEDKVIKQGYPRIAEKVLMVDFDGTLFPFGQMFTYPEPLVGAVETMQFLKSKGYKIGIHTARLSMEWCEDEQQDMVEHLTYIVECLNIHKIPYDFVTSEKRPAEAYIDDRAITFTNWEDIRRRYEDS